ncbi:methyl-accepting chemotaxis protein [Alicyclobacillus acidoterrestris]|nr:methyl-accepting chemotaxis protein [Alicyclobacillus acidoterrestris]
MIGKFLNSVNQKLILSFIAVLLIPSLVVSVIAYRTSYAKMADELLNNATNNVALMNSDISKYIQPEMNNITYLSEEISKSDWSSNDGAKLDAILSSFSDTHPELADLDFASTTGFYRNYSSQQVPNGFNAQQQPWYQQAEQVSGQICILDPYPSSLLKGQLVIGISEVVHDGSGVIHCEIPVSALSDVIGSVKIGQTGFPLIIDRAKKVVIDPALKAGEDVSKLPWVNSMYTNTDGSETYTQDGHQQKLVYTTNPITGWKIAGAMNTQDMTNAARPILTTTLIVLVIALILASGLIYINIRNIVSPLRKLVQTTKRVGAGDLKQRVHIANRDEFGLVSNSFNQMVDTLETVIDEVSQTSDKLAAASQELAASAEETNKSAEHVSLSIHTMSDNIAVQARNVSESLAAVTGISEDIEQISNRAQSVGDAATEASDIAKHGNDSIQHAITQMSAVGQGVTQLAELIHTLATNSQDIGNLTELITSIASQIHLLALNAAIEAAHAGEHGRGFAIVAEEVRKLAGNTADAARQIVESISLMQAQSETAVTAMQSAQTDVNNGIQAVHVAGTSFERIMEAVEAVQTQILDVSSAAQQIAAGTSQVLTSIQQIAASAEQNAGSSESVAAMAEEQMATMQEVAASTQELSRMAEQLRLAIAHFQQ